MIKSWSAWESNISTRKKIYFSLAIPINLSKKNQVFDAFVFVCETHLIIFRLLFGCMRFAVTGSIFLKWLCNNSDDIADIFSAGINDSNWRRTTTKKPEINKIFIRFVFVKKQKRKKSKFKSNTYIFQILRHCGIDEFTFRCRIVSQWRRWQDFDAVVVHRWIGTANQNVPQQRFYVIVGATHHNGAFGLGQQSFDLIIIISIKDFCHIYFMLVSIYMCMYEYVQYFVVAHSHTPTENQTNIWPIKPAAAV